MGRNTKQGRYPAYRVVCCLCAICLVLLVGCASGDNGADDAPPLAVRLLDAWQPVEDRLTVDDPAQRWQFVGTQGDRVRLQVEVVEGAADPFQITVSNSAGATLVTLDAPEVAFILPEDGAYDITIRLEPRAFPAADYRLTLAYTDRTAPPSPTPSRTPSFTLTPTLTRTATRTSTPTRTQQPSRTPTRTFSPTATLTRTRTPTATASATPSFTPTYTNTPTPTPTFTATYTPSHTYTPSNTPTPFYAALGALVGTLLPGQFAENTLISSFDRHVYRFDGQQGEVISVVVEALDATAAAPNVVLFAPYGGRVAGEIPTSRLTGIELAQTGEYVVQVISGETAGGYRITLYEGIIATPTPTPLPPLATGQSTPVNEMNANLTAYVTQVGTLEAGELRRYFIQAEPTEIVTIGVRPVEGSPVRPFVQLINPNGDLLFETGVQAEFGNVALIPGIGLAEGGVYSLLITDEGNSGGTFLVGYGRGGGYTEEVRGYLPAGQATVDAQLTQPGIAHRWTVALNAGGEFASTLTAPTNTSANRFQVELITPQGETLAVVPPDYIAPVNGLYGLRISAINGRDIGLYTLNTGDE